MASFFGAPLLQQETGCNENVVRNFGLFLWCSSAPILLALALLFGELLHYLSHLQFELLHSLQKCVIGRRVWRHGWIFWRAEQMMMQAPWVDRLAAQGIQAPWVDLLAAQGEDHIDAG